MILEVFEGCHVRVKELVKHSQPAAILSTARSKAVAGVSQKLGKQAAVASTFTTLPSREMPAIPMLEGSQQH